MWQPLLLSAGCIPIGILLAVVLFERWQRKRRGERSPLSEKLLRPPGYSLQRKLEDLNDSFSGWFSLAFLFSVLAVIIAPSAPNANAARIPPLIVLGMASAGCVILAWRRLGDIRSYRTGLLGEQAVAEELLRLIPFGYQIFHDVPGSGKWNIDHIVVGPAGVFAIETKYRTKKPGKNSERDYDATFDGNRIEFASGDYDLNAASQARDNARWLEKELSKATGERVNVCAIVALPGWYVTLKANSDVKVLSGKQIAGFISKEPPKLSDKFIRQISYQLEQRCRDVEF